MRVFLDTNVLVSAFATRGLCADLLRTVLVQHELLVGEVVLAELRRALVQKVGAPPKVIDEIEGFLRGYQVVPRPPSHLALGLRDIEDEWIVVSAAAGGADLLVTGDADLLKGHAPMPVRVLSPRDSWRVLRGPEGGGE